MAKIQIPFKDVVASLESLSEPSQEKVTELLYRNFYEKTDVFYIQERCFEDLVRSPLFTPVDSTPDNLLRAYSKDELLAVLQESGLEGYRPNMRIATLIRWCLENIPNLWDVIPPVHAVRFSDQVLKSRRKLYTYLLRKYEWEEVWGEDGPVKVPHGSQCEDLVASIGLDGVSFSGNPDAYWFPDDEITDLLTEYGHNRCLNGYKPENN